MASRPKHVLLASLPLDVLCELFSFCHPADLLVFARVSKAFHSFLLKSPFIWRSARRRNVRRLPEPPSDMNEIQYAFLVFGSRCHYTGCDKRARDTVWHLRIRSCASCRPKHQPINLNESQDLIAVRRMLDCYPDALEQYIPCGPFLNAKGKPIKGFQEADIKTFKDDLGPLSPSDRQAYLDRRRQATERISQFANTGVAWQLDAKNERIMKMRNKRAARAEIIHDILVTTGFRDEINHFGWDRIRKHPLISSTQSLTEKVRSSVLDQLREYMLAWRELRMEEQVYAFRRQVFVDAWLQFTTTTFANATKDCPYLPLPPSSTIGFLGTIDSIIRQSGPISESYESFLGQLHAAFFPAREYILDWHRTIRRELASLLPNYTADDDDEAIHVQLKLATSVFQCNSPHCRREGLALAYPEILFHPCFTLMTAGNGPSRNDPKSIAHEKACLIMGGPWNCSGRVKVHPKQYVVDNILSCCEQDPRSITAAEMDEQDPRLACVECAVRDKVIVSMSWRRAVRHSITFHPTSTLDRSWVMACPIVRVRISMLEPKIWRPFPSVLGDNLGDYSACLHCPPRIPSWNTSFRLRDMMDHIKNLHGVPIPILGKDYVFDQNITPVYPDPMIAKRKTNS